MKKPILFLAIASALITISLASTSCTKTVAEKPTAPAEENLTVVIGSVSASGDTTIYLQTIVRPK